MLSRNIKRIIQWIVLLFFILITISIYYKWLWWAPEFLKQILSSEKKIEVTANFVQLVTGILAIITETISIIVLIKFFLIPPKPQINRLTLDTSLPLTSVEKILNIDLTGERKLVPWVDRKLVTTDDLRENPVIVFVGRMKSGKTREAGELIHKALNEGIVDSENLYDITNAFREFSPETTPMMLGKKLKHGYHVLTYLNEIPADVTQKYIDALNVYLKALGKYYPNYFVTTVRAEYLENNPRLRKWMTEIKAKIINMKSLTRREKNQFINELIKMYPINWKNEYRPYLLEYTDGTPYHLILTFQYISTMHQNTVTQDEIMQIVSETLKEKWKNITRDIKESEPTIESLLNALAVFYHTNVTPKSELVFALAEKMERSKQPWWKEQEIHHDIERAAKMVRHYDITYKEQFIFPSLAVEYLILPDEAYRILENFLRNESFTKSIKMKSSRVKAIFQLGVSYYFRNEIYKAAEMFKWVTEANPKENGAWSNLGMLLKNMGRKEEAEEAYLKAVEANPKDAGSWFNLGMLMQDLGRKEEAEDAYRKAVDVDPMKAETWYILGVLLQETGRRKEAEDAYRNAVEVNPNDAGAWYNLGVLYKDLGRKEEAEEAYRKAVEVNPKDAGAWSNLGVLYKLLGRKEEAEEAYRKAVEVDPKETSAWFNLGVLLKDFGRSVEAEEAYKKAVETDPYNASAWFNLGNLMVEEGRKMEAEDIYRKAIDINPKNAAAWSNLGVLLDDQGRKEDAESILKKAVNIDSQIAETWYALGDLYRRQNKFKESISALEEATQNNPEKAIYHASLGAIYLKLGQSEKAEKEFSRTKQLWENESRYNRACIAIQIGELELGFSLLKEAINKNEVSLDWIRMNPDWEDMQNNPEFRRMTEEFEKKEKL